MHARSWFLSVSCTFLALGPVACDDPSTPGPEAEDTETSSAPGTTGEDPTADGSDGSDGGTSTGEPGDGYPADVLDHLDLPWPPYGYDDELPAHFQTPGVQDLDNTPGDNPITDAGATLGRVLFYDVALSANETIACASCHAQDTGFTDPDQFSEGFEGGLTGRNSMGLSNARFYAPGRFFWDERADTLEDQVLMPIQNEVEMGLTLPELVARVQSQPYYPFLFEQAFGDPGVDADRISRALAQYVRAIVSHRSSYDEGLAAVGNPADPFPNFTAQQNEGKAIFFGPAGRCAPCHVGQPGPPPPPGAPLPNAAVFMMTAPANNGLDAGPVTADNGIGDVTGNPMDDGRFKSPSLRNVEHTGPYMHDGRFETLEQVVEHYADGVQPHPNLDPRLRTPDGQPQRLNLSGAQRTALVEFLRTLTDDALAEDVRFSDPFRD
ncbi:cytochrome-c peroxidase [Paraliomyxa miuraensis]|uniref:cytochrome-c peroxidase n=1 Tax=Paraliomyxa miuraensis TaxID=376150 RepID=UPI00224E5457|nr:cytochrome c peroxidase [Paraliomyxa miuraensis]MCX4245890.1 cytochrome-c peroxidase [Paraliomyxa miuraensis]